MKDVVNSRLNHKKDVGTWGGYQKYSRSIVLAVKLTCAKSMHFISRVLFQMLVNETREILKQYNPRVKL